MKKIIFILGLLILAVACEKKLDKKAELAKLIKEREKITEQITKLQEEINAQDTSAGAKMKIKNVAVTTIALQPFNHYIEIQGKVDGDDNVAVSPKTIGIVTNIRVIEGDQVRKGQVLAELDGEVMKRSMTQLTEQLNFATTIFNKQKNLWDQKIGSEIQFLTAKNNKENLENQLKTMQEQLEMTRIIAPINGTVEEIPIKVGQSLAPGMVAFRVINFSKAKIMAELAEAYAPKVKSGDKVKIYFPDYQREIEAQLSFASRFINPTNRTFQVESRFNPGELEMKANMIAVVKINDYAVKETIVVPINAVQKDLDGQFVFIAEEGGKQAVAKKRPVTMGMVYNGMVEIKEGLKPGEKVVTMGYQDLNDGQYLKF
ncbi:MAG: efflux RND transporter periplasmic adaptor subunit [Bacteroidales bacterium]